MNISSFKFFENEVIMRFHNRFCEASEEIFIGQLRVGRLGEKMPTRSCQRVAKDY